VLSQLDRLLTPERVGKGDDATAPKTSEQPGAPESPVRRPSASKDPLLPPPSKSPAHAPAWLRGSVVDELLRSADEEEDLEAYSHRALHTLYCNTVRDIGRISASMDAGMFTAALEERSRSPEVATRHPVSIPLPLPPTVGAEPVVPAPPAPAPVSSFSPSRAPARSAGHELRGSVVNELLRSAAAEDLDAYSHRALHVSPLQFSALEACDGS
jgi:hypothetical protein